MLSDPDSRLRRLWGQTGWSILGGGNRPCWEGRGEEFFASAARGDICGRNWYEGNEGDLGRDGPTKQWVHPHFTSSAPALLGFDEGIDWYCGSRGGRGNHAETCVSANINILSLYGEYNICRNCARLKPTPLATSSHR